MSEAHIKGIIHTGNVGKPLVPSMVEKDVTYATFSDKEFIELLEKGLGKGYMAEILEEHDAARAA